MLLLCVCVAVGGVYYVFAGGGNYFHLEIRTEKGGGTGAKMVAAFLKYLSP